MPHLTRFAAAALLLAASGLPALAQDKGGIKGQDVLGDTSRSANDGWSQAPVPREQSAGKDAPDPGGQSTAQNKDRPVPPSETPNKTGQEPQEPLPHRTPNPSGSNPASPSK